MKTLLAKSLFVLPLAVVLPACSTLPDRFGRPLNTTNPSDPPISANSAWPADPQAPPALAEAPATADGVETAPLSEDVRPVTVVRFRDAPQQSPAASVASVEQTAPLAEASAPPDSDTDVPRAEADGSQTVSSSDSVGRVSYEAAVAGPTKHAGLPRTINAPVIKEAPQLFGAHQAMPGETAVTPLADSIESHYEVGQVETPGELAPKWLEESCCPACQHAECRCANQTYRHVHGWPPAPNADRFCPLESYLSRASMNQSSPVVAEAGVEPMPFDLPSHYLPWWHDAVVSGEGVTVSVIGVSSEQLVVSALRNAQFIKALADFPLIHETNVIEAEAEFDVSAFMESKFLRPSEPVGSDLTTGPGGPRRFREQNWNYSLGVRKKVATGGNFELSQQIGLLDNNSLNLNPKNQGNARFKLSFSQPLLSGAGKVYNTSLIVLAEVDERVAWDKLSTQLQDYLLDVIRAYWELYLQRAVLQQKVRHLQRGQEILFELEDRREIDAAHSQIARARAAVTSRQSEIIRAETAVRNAESQIRALVNAPGLIDSGHSRMVPTEAPARELVVVSKRDAIVSALENRPEIDKAIQQVRSAGVRLKVSENELRPVLDVVLETYVSGLRGSSDIGQALVDQFSVGEPSYSAGLLFELPLHNRAARARYARRKLEMRQLLSQFRSTVESLMADVEISVREVETTYHEMQSRYRAMVANEIDLDALTERWHLLPGDDRSASFVLEEILDAQDRLASEELEFVRAQVSYTLSLAALNRAQGVLLQTEQVDAFRGEDCGLPRLLLEKPVNEFSDSDFSDPDFPDPDFPDLNFDGEEILPDELPAPKAPSSAVPLRQTGW